MTHEPRFLQSVEIVVQNIEFRRPICITYLERWATNMVVATRPTHQAARKSCFATPQVTYELDDFATLKLLPEALGDLLGGF